MIAITRLTFSGKKNLTILGNAFANVLKKSQYAEHTNVSCFFPASIPKSDFKTLPAVFQSDATKDFEYLDFPTVKIKDLQVQNPGQKPG